MNKNDFTHSFMKINATGNDFIVIDNRQQLQRAEDRELWARLCHLKSGIGADGVLLLEASVRADFKMRYINADGGEVEMCGNGARAITAFAHKALALNKEIYTFETMNGIYECALDKNYGYRLKMTELYDIDKVQTHFPNIASKSAMYLNTGVPHCVFEVENLMDFPVYEKGRMVRFDERFEKGCNANFFEVLLPGHLRVRTYERGVENETLSCGTGITATAIAAAKFYKWKEEVLIDSLGGRLAVQFNEDFSTVYLCGQVQIVFVGKF